MGGTFAGELARAGHDVAVLARGAHLDAIRARGLEVRTPDETFRAEVRASADAADLGAADLVVVAVKNYSLGEVAPAAAALAAAGATVVPLLNGVEAADRLVSSGVPPERLLPGLTEVSAARIAPGVVERKSTFQRIAIGEPSGESSARVEAIAAAFRSARVDTRVSSDTQAELWRKLAFIASMAAACGLARAPVGVVREAPYGRDLFRRLVDEALSVARARSVRVGDEAAAKILSFVEGLAPALRPSFLLDLEAGGPTELDDLCGAISRLGRSAGVETPVHDAATAALSATISARRA